jgi:hypothetical protein
VQALVETLDQFGQREVGLFCQPLLQLQPYGRIQARGQPTGMRLGSHIAGTAQLMKSFSTKERLTPNSSANSRCEPAPRSYACTIFWRKSRE